jgi:hypothetical protein
VAFATCAIALVLSLWLPGRDETRRMHAARAREMESDVLQPAGVSTEA